jgi:hypothetical protein
MSKDSFLAHITARPVRTSVSERLGHGYRFGAQRLGLLETVYAEDSAHVERSMGN